MIFYEQTNRQRATKQPFLIAFIDVQSDKEKDKQRDRQKIYKVDLYSN